MDEIMNRIGEVYEPFKVHFLHKPVRPAGTGRGACQGACQRHLRQRSAHCARAAPVCPAARDHRA